MIDDGDQRDRRDGPGDVAQRVELLVGRREPVAGRADRPRRPTRAGRASRRCDSAARQPGIDSSLSSVPPVWPRPRPVSCGTATPQAATSGASGRVILSPTPPVECLSAVGRESAGEVQPLAGRDHRGGPAGDLARGHPVEQDRHRQRRHLLVGDDAARVGVDDPVDLAVGELAAVALGGMTSTASSSSVRRHPTASRSSGPNASGSTSAIGADAPRRHQQQLGAAVLPQQLPAPAARHEHVAVAVDAARTRVSRPPPVGVQRDDQTALGAQHDAVRRVLDVAADHDPAVVGDRRPPRPGSGSTARTRAAITSTAAARERLPVERRPVAPWSLLDVRLAVGGRRAHPPDQPGHRDDRGDVGQHREERRTGSTAR